MNKIKSLLIIAVIAIGCSQTEDHFFETKDAYFGLIPPRLVPEVFAPNIVSDSTWAEHCQILLR